MSDTISDLENLQKVFFRGGDSAYRRWLGKNNLKQLKVFCNKNEIQIEGRKTRDKMVQAIYSMLKTD